MNLCDDNRIITIEKTKQALIKGTNIEDSPEEMKVLDNILFRCWQMGWLDRYAPPRHFNALPKGISERLAAGHGSNVPMQPNIPPMPSNTSNALKALNSVNATQFNALDSISRQAAIEVVQNRPMMLSKEKVLLINDLEKLPPAQTESCEDTVSRQRLLSSLKELVVAWEKYPVMAEQIKGVEAAIGYVETIPTAQPESDSGRWERHYSRPGVYADLCWHCSKCGYKTDYQYAHVNHRYCQNCGRKMEREVSDE